MSKKDCVIIGASHAGVTLAMQLRKEGWKDGIILIGEEPELPYHRPPLSKEHLAGEKAIDAMRLRPEKMFIDNNIELKLGITVLQIDVGKKNIMLSNGQEINYEKLALCTGSTVNKISIGESLDNIFYVRTAADVALLSQQLSNTKNAVIIGAGYIGLESAAVLSKLGLTVTVIERADRILERVTGEIMSSYISALHKKEGVNILTSTTVENIEGDCRVEKVICQDGRELLADIVIIGVGVSPNINLAEAAGLEVNHGIVVNKFTQTSTTDIFSAGDCTIHPSQIYKRNIRLESVQNANDQARCAAANICDKQETYNAVPWFWSDQFGIKLQMTGLSTGADETVLRGDPSPESESGFVVFYLKEGEIIAADCVGRPKEFMLSKQLVRERVRIPASVLADESVETSLLLGKAI
ncbi:MAG: FAD-dependent oxidoreductase [Gammaproteobacteria bacterium]|nr:FAD-dependent oxidoreductase [Gammaproteobacteria bacterium]